MCQNPEFYFKIIVVRLPMVVLGVLAGFTLAIAQPQPSGPAQTSQNSQAPYVAQYEGRITVRADGTATERSDLKFKNGVRFRQLANSNFRSLKVWRPWRPSKPLQRRPTEGVREKSGNSKDRGGSGLLRQDAPEIAWRR
jgi:hypothetical protein